MSIDFSVVIPLYNKGPHVRSAVESALGQSLSPAEIIVVDDGSTDGGLELVRQIQDPRLRIFTRNEPGPGGYAARNLGVESARSEWVAFLDADDIWKKDHLRSLSDAIAVIGCSADCAFSAVELTYPERREVRRNSRRHLPTFKPLRAENIVRAWLEVGQCPLWTGAVAFRRDLLLRAGLFPAGMARRGGDKDLWLRAMLMADTFVYTGQLTAEFHQVAVNRVSDHTPHSELPIVVATINERIGAAAPHLRPLLKRLANMEISTYARYSARRGVPIFGRFARRLYYPIGVAALAKIAGCYAAGLVVRLLGPPDTIQVGALTPVSSTGRGG